MAALLLMAVSLIACARGETKALEGTLPAIDNPPGILHIHGLGVNPADHSLYAATHGGLYRIDEGRASIVANRYQDTMAFTIIGKDHFIASGHPDLREDLPALLGLLESHDAGKTWTTRSLLGRADFHALRYAHGRTWGYDSTSGSLTVSSDRKEWSTRSSLVLRDFVVSPDSAEVLLATNAEALMRSADGGRSWKTTDSPEAPMLLWWTVPNELWLIDAEGAVHRSDDAGENWEHRGDLPGRPEALTIDGELLYAATHNAIFASDDEGETWKPIYNED